MRERTRFAQLSTFPTSVNVFFSPPFAVPFLAYIKFDYITKKREREREKGKETGYDELEVEFPMKLLSILCEQNA